MGDKNSTIIDIAQDLNVNSTTLTREVAPGNTTFLQATKNSSIKQFEGHQDQSTFTGVVIESRKVSSDNQISKLAGILLVNGEDLVIRVRIPGLHDHLPDPFKHKNQLELLQLYPTFTSSTKQLGGEQP